MFDLLHDQKPVQIVLKVLGGDALKRLHKISKPLAHIVDMLYMIDLLCLALAPVPESVPESGDGPRRGPSSVFWERCSGKWPLRIRSGFEWWCSHR